MDGGVGSYPPNVEELLSCIQKVSTSYNDSILNDAVNAINQLSTVFLFKQPNQQVGNKICSALIRTLNDIPKCFPGFGSFASAVLRTLKSNADADLLRNAHRMCFFVPDIDNTSLIQLLKFVAHNLESADASYRSQIITLFIDEDSQFFFDRVFDENVHLQLVRVYSKLLSESPKPDIVYSQKVYALLVEMIIRHIDALKSITASTMEMIKTERLLAVLLSTLHPMCTIMALSPSILEFFFRLVPLTESWFFSNFPLLHMSFLATAFTFAKTHEFFVATSSWRGMHMVFGVSPSALFLQQQLEFLGELLQFGTKLKSGTLNILIEWLFSISATLGTDTELIAIRPEMIPLRKAVLQLLFHDGMSAPTRLDNVVYNFNVFETLSNAPLEECENIFSLILRSQRFRSTDGLHRIIKHIPMHFFHQLLSNEKYLTVGSQEMPLGSFLNEERWFLLRSFLFPLTAEGQKRPADLAISEWNSMIAAFVTLLVNGQMESPTPTQLGKLILDELNRKRTQSPKPTDGMAREWLRAQCLLHLIDLTDKSISMESNVGNTQQEIIKYFDWQREIFIDLFRLAFQVENYAFIVYFLPIFLSGNVWDSEVLKAICWTVRSYAAMRSVSGIRGLRSYVFARFQHNLVWLDPIEIFCEGRFEESLVNLDIFCAELTENADVRDSLCLVREMAVRAINDESLCRILSPGYFSIDRAVGSKRSDLLNSTAVINLSSWNTEQKVPLSEAHSETSIFHIQHQFDRIETTTVNLHTIFSHFGVASAPDVLTKLTELERQLVEFYQLAREKLFILPFGPRAVSLHSVLRLFYSVIESAQPLAPPVEPITRSLCKIPYYGRLQSAQNMCLWVSRLFGPQSSNLNLFVTKFARKTGNYSLASHQLQKQPALNPFFAISRAAAAGKFDEIQKLTEALKLDFHNHRNNVATFLQRFGAVTEIAASTIDVHLDNSVALNADVSPLMELCLTLAKLSRLFSSGLEGLFTKPSLNKTMFWSKVVGEVNTYNNLCQGRTAGELFCGAFLSIASSLCSSAFKAHRRLACWAIDQTSIDSNCGVDAIRLMPAESIAISALCGDLSVEMEKHLLLAIGRTSSISQLGKFLRSSMENEAALTTVLSGIHSAAFDELWDLLKRRQKFFYGIAVRSLIVLTEIKDTPLLLAIESCLRLMEFMTSHVEWSDDVGDEWIERTNVVFWKECVTELFAQLNNPGRRVREIFSPLLKLVAINYPHAVCYPALMRSNSFKTLYMEAPETPAEPKIDVDAISLGMPADHCATKGNANVTEVCTELISLIKENHCDLVDDVSCFIEGFQQFVNLPAERWLFVLNHLEQEWIHRYRHNTGMMKTMEETTLFNKNSISTVEIQLNENNCQNCLDVLNDLLRTTVEKSDETVEETNFMNAFGDEIRRSIRRAEKKLQNRTFSFEPFRKLMDSLSYSISKRCRYNLRLKELSPLYFRLNSTAIPIPGQEGLEFNTGIVTVARVQQNVIMLSTKTRPKKLTMLGSDGQEYTFLCKGQEDLRLDERIFNILRTSNCIFNASKFTRNAEQSYSTRYYTVTPLGPRSGIMNWIHGSVSVYQLYRLWKSRKLKQHRQSCSRGLFEIKVAENAIISPKETKEPNAIGSLVDEDELSNPKAQPSFGAALSQNSAVLSPMDKTVKVEEKAELVSAEQMLRAHPADMFNNCLRKILQSAGMGRLRSRKEWPPNLLDEVLNELEKHTTDQLIASEIRQQSENAHGYWRKTEQFSRSLAVMSVIGAVLGLGDRHLDNILIDFENGNVVHVDYNVCFGKGQFLRVPERVPFRLTRNFVSSLGFLGIGGNFQYSAENTLSALRSQQFVLRSLLTPLLTDPQIDWASRNRSLIWGHLGVSLTVYGEDRRLLFSSKRYLGIFKTLVNELEAKFNSLLRELQTALAEICNLFVQMNAYRNNPVMGTRQTELEHFETQRVKLGTRLRSSICTHQSVMRLLRPPLKMLTCVDSRFHIFMNNYRVLFSEPLVRGHRLLNEKYIDYERCIECFNMAQANLPSIYLQIVELSKLETTNIDRIESEEFKETQNLEDVAKNSVHEILKTTMDNLMGNGVTPQEQIKFWIESAVDRRNLALMYEGWTAWV